MENTKTVAPATKGLADGKLGLWDSVFIGVCSTAPAYSLAATLGFVVLAVGTKAPLALVLAFVPMFLVAMAYKELNAEDPDCGTTFTWAKKAFGKHVGWLGGWALALSGVIVLANLAQVSGQYLWLLLDPELSESKYVVAATGLVFIAITTWISYRGVELGAKLQNSLLFAQYIPLGVLAAAAIWRLSSGQAFSAEPFSWDWFSLAGADWHDMLYAVLLALFIYWGWDSCLALNEETRNPRKTPGRAALLSSVILMASYVGLAVLLLMVFGDGSEGLGLGNQANAADVLHATSQYLLGEWGWLVVAAVLISAFSSTQTTILPTARGTLSMAVQGALPARFAKVHPKHKTPSTSTLVMGAVASVYFVVVSLLSDNFLQDSIAAISLFIAFYYAITASACAWIFRNTLDSFKAVMFRMVLPLLGAVSMGAAFVLSAIDMMTPEYGETVFFGLGGAFVIGIGLICLGVPLMLWQYRRSAQPAT